MTFERGPQKVEVSHKPSPDGEMMILVQMSTGWIMTTAEGAREVAALLVEAADALDQET